MTAIRKSGLQYVHFQCFTSKTTKIGYSNDRFGFIGWTLLMAFGVGLTESLSTVVSAIGNVGPGLGTYGPVYSWHSLPDAAKWVLSALMLIGRLEIFGILLLFYKRFWNEY